MLEPELEGDAATAVNSSATKLHYYATPLAMPVKRRRRRRGGRERERMVLLACSHSHTTTGRGRGRSVESLFKERPSSKKWPQKKYGPRGRNVRRVLLRAGDDARVTIPPLVQPLQPSLLPTLHFSKSPSHSPSTIPTVSPSLSPISKS